jgi:hypothetical protein
MTDRQRLLNDWILLEAKRRKVPEEQVRKEEEKVDKRCLERINKQGVRDE